MSIYVEGDMGSSKCPYCQTPYPNIVDEYADDRSYSVTYVCKNCGATGAELYEVVGTTWHEPDPK